MLTKNLSIELDKDGIIVVALNPGWVKTDNGGENATITTAQSVSGMLSVLGNLNQSQSGCFISYDGTQVPW